MHRVSTTIPHNLHTMCLKTGFLLFALSVILCLQSCVSPQDLVYFNQGQTFPDSLQDIQNLPVLKIQTDDLLSIRVRASGLDPEIAAPYNLDPVTGQFVGGQMGENRAAIGYLVDKEGYIDFPALGAIKVVGMTTAELKEEIEQRLVPYLKDPIVIVRYFNFRITMLGEVRSPGTYVMPTERVSILDALGEAGDMTDYANRRNVLLVREQEGRREYVHLDLHDRNIFKSPYFYLVQNDLIYVEPVSLKAAGIRDQSQRITPWISVVGSTLSLVVAIISLTRQP